jgi:hypothetical protein
MAGTMRVHLQSADDSANHGAFMARASLFVLVGQ